MPRQRFINFWITILVILFAVCFSMAGHSLTANEVINPQINGNGWVTDQASVLERKTELILNQQITEFEAKTTGEMAVVTVPNVEQNTNVRQFAIALFNTWGIGKAGKNNGVLLLLSMGDRQVELVTGKGIDHILTNAIAHRIVQTKILPALKQEDPNTAVLVGTNAILATLREAGLVGEIRLYRLASPGLISSVLLIITAFFFYKLKQAERQAPLILKRYRLLLIRSKYYDWHGGKLTQFQQQHRSNHDTLKRFVWLRKASFFVGMLALTNIFLAAIGVYLPVGIALAFSLCFPLTFTVKNLSQLSPDRREGIVAGIVLQSFTAIFMIGIIGTLFLENVDYVHWSITLLLAIIASGFNTINWHQYFIIQRGKSSYSSSDYSGSSGLSSGSDGGSVSSAGFGGGTSDGGGAGGDW